MNVAALIAQLKAERNRLDAAIAALEFMNRTKRKAARPRRGGRMSAAARKRLSRLLKARWAAGKMGRRKKK